MKGHGTDFGHEKWARALTKWASELDMVSKERQFYGASLPTPEAAEGERIRTGKGGQSGDNTCKCFTYMLHTFLKIILGQLL